jgi:hypothetical protein
MRFRKTSTPPPYLNSRHQRRLLMLAGLLVLVFVAMRVAAKPETWSWLFAGAKNASKTATPARQAKTAAKQPPSPLERDEFRANAVDARRSNRARPSAASSGVALASAPDAATPDAATPDAVDLTLDGKLFAKVEDATYAVPFKELDGYYAVLARVAVVPQQALQDLAKRNGPVPTSVLRNEPKSHRGRAITIDGKLGSLKVLPNSRPELGLKTLYEAWIVTPDSDNDPYRVVFSELPQGLQPRDRFDDPPQVRATGYFFKVQTYELKPGDDQSHTTPLILAKRIQPLDVSEAAPQTSGLAAYVIGFALVLGAILAVFLWRFSIGDRQFAEQQLQRYDVSRQANPSDLKHLETTEDPQEFFRRLSEADSAAKPGNDAPR